MPSDDYDRYRTHHTSRRLRGFDYTRAAAYFITLCTHDRACLFGTITGAAMHPNAAGAVVAEEWRRSEAMRDEIALDAFVVMPNHVHGIAVIVPSDARTGGDALDPRGYALDVHDGGGDVPDDLDDDDPNGPVATHGRASLPHRKPKSLGSFIAGFKAAATKRINRQRGTPGAAVWQPNYYDRILRDEREWRGARRYIRHNPARWRADRHHPEA